MDDEGYGVAVAARVLAALEDEGTRAQFVASGMRLPDGEPSGGWVCRFLRITGVNPRLLLGLGYGSLSGLDDIPRLDTEAA